VFNAARLNEIYASGDSGDELNLYLLCGTQAVYVHVGADFGAAALYVAPGSAINYGDFGSGVSDAAGGLVRRRSNKLEKRSAADVYDTKFGTESIVSCCFSTPSMESKANCPMGTTRCEYTFATKKRRRDAALALGEYADLVQALTSSAQSVRASIAAAAKQVVASSSTTADALQHRTPRVAAVKSAPRLAARAEPAARNAYIALHKMSK